ncbi:MAG: hypothetical protein ACRCX4_10075 [Bacteroidales bacterium]
MEAHHLFSEFKRILENVAIREIERKEKDEYDRVWNNLLFEDLSLWGISKELEVVIRPALSDISDSTHTVPPVDFMWNRRENGFLSKIELGVQCEWSANPEMILAAFEKLLVLECHHKILVCQQKRVTDMEALFSRIEVMIDVFESPQSVQNYLIAVWINDHFEWKEVMS